MKCKYFYLGLESRVASDNRYGCIDDALSVAIYAAKQLNAPIRIFAMLDNNKAVVVETVSPDDCFGFELYEREKML